jgi:hypothetical protein
LNGDRSALEGRSINPPGRCQPALQAERSPHIRGSGGRLRWASRTTCIVRVCRKRGSWRTQCLRTSNTSLDRSPLRGEGISRPRRAQAWQFRISATCLEAVRFGASQERTRPAPSCP